MLENLKKKWKEAQENKEKKLQSTFNKLDAKRQKLERRTTLKKGIRSQKKEIWAMRTERIKPVAKGITRTVTKTGAYLVKQATKPKPRPIKRPKSKFKKKTGSWNKFV